jgi:hypothetical protein
MAMPIISWLVQDRLYFQTADVLLPTFVQAAGWTAADAHHVDMAQPPKQQTPAPLSRCDECALNLGRDVLRALWSCPRWGGPRHGVETSGPAFVAKDGVR